MVFVDDIILDQNLCFWFASNPKEEKRKKDPSLRGFMTKPTKVPGELGIFEGDGNLVSQCGDVEHYWLSNEIRAQHSILLGSEVFGVADSYQQIKKTPVYQFAQNDTKKYFIVFQRIYRKDQPKTCGWRWHKWGAYIGTKKHCHEYLYDDTNIKSIIIYHIYQIK